MHPNVFNCNYSGVIFFQTAAELYVNVVTIDCKSVVTWYQLLFSSFIISRID